MNVLENLQQLLLVQIGMAVLLFFTTWFSIELGTVITRV